MMAALPDPRDAVARLQAALGAPALPPREAEMCARLVEKLSRPVRVGIFGLSDSGDDWLLSAILGEGVLPWGGEWPTLEVVHGPEHVTHVTYEDGETRRHLGAADPGILADMPVFLRVEAPRDVLARMSFLYLASDDHAPDQLAALDWAEPRTDIAIWTTNVFRDEEARIWAAAPDKLKNHALLVATGYGIDEPLLAAHAGYDFDGVFAVPRHHPGAGGVARLLRRLDSDINEARAADIDAAHVFLHRLGHLAPTPVAVAAPAARRPSYLRAVTPPEGLAEAPAEFTPQPPAQARPEPRPAPSPETVAMVSEPILYLKRRARALLEMLEWHVAETGPAQDAWAEEVLAHVCETAEGLRDRALNWPEDDTAALTLRRSLDEACDVAILLQVEGGRDQAEDAAVMLMQLRGAFERELAA